VRKLGRGVFVFHCQVILLFTVHAKAPPSTQLSVC
jgi:hypothetical protein